MLQRHLVTIIAKWIQIPTYTNFQIDPLNGIEIDMLRRHLEAIIAK